MNLIRRPSFESFCTLGIVAGYAALFPALISGDGPFVIGSLLFLTVIPFVPAYRKAPSGHGIGARHKWFRCATLGGVVWFLVMAGMPLTLPEWFPPLPVVTAWLAFVALHETRKWMRLSARILLFAGGTGGWILAIRFL